MFDAETVALIAQAPPLEGLDLARLPQDFTEVYAEIVTARIWSRQVTTGGSLPATVRNSIKRMRRLAWRKKRLFLHYQIAKIAPPQHLLLHQRIMFAC